MTYEIKLLFISFIKKKPRKTKMKKEKKRKEKKNRRKRRKTTTDRLISMADIRRSLEKDRLPEVRKTGYLFIQCNVSYAPICIMCKRNRRYNLSLN